MKATTTQRFMKKVDPHGPVPAHRPALGPCWLWLAASHPSGYGRFQMGPRSCLAHRVAYELFVGPIPDGLTIDHLCRNPPCVNPDHLEPCTMRENVHRSPDTMASINAAKTHCPEGHAFTPENTYERPPNGRGCRTCRTQRQRLARQAKRSAA